MMQSLFPFLMQVNNALSPADNSNNNNYLILHDHVPHPEPGAVELRYAGGAAAHLPGYVPQEQTRELCHG